MLLTTGLKGIFARVPMLLLAAARLVRADERADAPVLSHAELRSADMPEEKTSSRRSSAAAVTELPTERLRQAWTADDAQLQLPVVHRSTLAEVIRRMAFAGDACPLCGKPHSERAEHHEEGPCATQCLATERQAFSRIGMGRAAETAEEPSPPESLRNGEPAQVILDTQKRLGKSVLDGTEFGGSPDLLIQWIRVLDEEHRRRAALDESPRAELIALSEADQPITERSQVDALREAGRQLQNSADLLEDQNLFDSADSLRELADTLRRQARQKLSEVRTANGKADSEEVVGESRDID